MAHFKNPRFNKNLYNTHTKSRLLGNSGVPNGTSFTIQLSRYNKSSNVFLATMIDMNADLENSEGQVRGPSLEDPQGAMLYVVVVIFLWGFSIVLLIASYIRKNHTDRSVSLYLEQIKTVRRKSRRESLFHTIACNLSQAQAENLGFFSPGNVGSSSELGFLSSSPLPLTPLIRDSMRPRAQSVPTPTMKLLTRISGNQLPSANYTDRSAVGGGPRSLYAGGRGATPGHYPVIPEHQSTGDLVICCGSETAAPVVSKPKQAFQPQIAVSSKAIANYNEGNRSMGEISIWSGDSFSGDEEEEYNDVL